MNRAAIYHFTDQSTIRPGVCQKQLDELQRFAKSLGYADTDVFLDKSIHFSDHPSFDNLIQRSDSYDAIIAKDFYRLSKNTGKCMRIMRDLLARGVKTHTMVNGSFELAPIPTDQPLRVATYVSRYGEQSGHHQILSVQNQILRLYIEKKTNWILKKQYSDETKTQRCDEQIQLQQLIDDKGSFDLVLVHNMNDIQWNTSRFCKIRDSIQMDIYALQDGFLAYHERSDQK